MNIKLKKYWKHTYITSKKDPCFSKLLLLFLIPLWILFIVVKITSYSYVSYEEQNLIIKFIYIANLTLILNWLRHYTIYTI